MTLDYEYLEPYGNLGEYVNSIIPARFKEVYYDETLQSGYAWETKCKVIEKAFDINPAETDEVRLYSKLNVDKVTNIRTGYAGSLSTDEVLKGNVHSYLDDQLFHYGKPPARVTK